MTGMALSAQEAWDKFIETGRVDYYLLSRGINIYAEGVLPSAQREALLRCSDRVGGDGFEPDGDGDRAAGAPVG